MRTSLLLLILALCPLLNMAQKKATVFIETESFKQKGGWVVDQQAMLAMGSPYLMAHGMGIPVQDAETTVKFPTKGKYHVYVRTRNWVARWSKKDAPGKFQLKVNGQTLPHIFGTKTQEWNWEIGGVIDINSKTAKVALHDLTGFNGRCDAIVFTTDPTFVPTNNVEALTSYRKKMLKLPSKPKVAGKYDFVIIGGGLAGTCAAISAARLGVKVALIQNRPILGGNNSSEVRVHLGARIRMEPYPALGNLVNEIGPVKGGNAEPKSQYEDDKKMNAVLAEKNISLFLNFNADKVTMNQNEIQSVEAQNIETGERLIFKGKMFADCTGDGIIGALAGADFMSGRESRSVFNEPTAPVRGDSLTMGTSVQWFSKKHDSPKSFPDIKWGLSWNEEKCHAIKRGDWNWETGMGLNMEQDIERIRDYGMLAVYSNWSYLKNHSSKKKKFANEKLQWVAYIGGKRESRRLTGDYVLTEIDLVTPKVYSDGTAPTTWSMDLHYPDPKNQKMFPKEPFKSIAKHKNIYPYPIPYRCMYSRNVNNLFMAGRNISVSHVALGTVRLMRTTGMMGEVLGMAASICKKHNLLPRGVYKTHFAELETLMEKGIGDPNLPNQQKYNMGGTLLYKKKH
ncbi:FAD-dependent oxidoreductase [Prolixibacteraceae bacterium JC049]|nr:FAD-dependent oxidoreductase [Prolixibacteraceae bacterium JC049]